MTYELRGNSLLIDCVLYNSGQRLPFGGGFHPFFPQFADTTLQFHCGGVWLSDAQRIPTEHRLIAQCMEWDFRGARPLPHGLLDNGFTGWTGAAQIVQPSLGISVTVDGSANLATALVYAPFPKEPFFCFEPVTHPVDAVNLPGMPGLQVLDRGDALRFSMQIAWAPLPTP